MIARRFCIVEPLACTAGSYGCPLPAHWCGVIPNCSNKCKLLHNNLAFQTTGRRATARKLLRGTSSKLLPLSRKPGCFPCKLLQEEHPPANYCEVKVGTPVPSKIKDVSLAYCCGKNASRKLLRGMESVNRIPKLRH